MKIGTIKGEQGESIVEVTTCEIIDTLSQDDTWQTGGVSASVRNNRVHVRDTTQIHSETTVNTRVRFNDGSEGVLPFATHELAVFKGQNIAMFYIDDIPCLFANLNTGQKLYEPINDVWSMSSGRLKPRWMPIPAGFIVGFFVSVISYRAKLDEALIAGAGAGLLIGLLVRVFRRIGLRNRFNEKADIIFDNYINAYRNQKGQVSELTPLSVEL
tara:strand:+ start:4671 stop:5312 length:642 start_codon:yes stop_codon:yes gene_type:complete